MTAPPNLGALLTQLRAHEGVRSKPYRDTVGKLTIGVGRNLDDRGLSPEEIDFLLSNDIDDHWVELLTALPWVTRLSPTRQIVLLDMAFNLGVPGLLKFAHTLDSIKSGDYALAAKQMLQSKWARQVGPRARRLSQMMLTDINPFL